MTSYNFLRSNLQKYFSALQRVISGGGQARFLFIGDDTTFGAWAGNGSTAIVNARLNGFPALFASFLASTYQTSLSAFVGDGNTGSTANTVLSDPRLSFGDWITTANSTAGGYMFYGNDNSGQLSFTPVEQCDTYEVYYALNPLTFGTLNILVGTTYTQVPLTAGNAIQKTVITTPSPAVQTISLSLENNGSALIAGVLAYNSTDPSVLFVNMGVQGWDSSSWVNASNGASPLNSISIYEPDLTFINLGINDFKAGGTNDGAAAYETHIEQLVQQAQLSGNVILLFPNDIETVGPEPTSDYLNALISVSNLYNVPLLDLSSILGTWATANANGLMHDALFPNQAGYQVIANSINQTIFDTFIYPLTNAIPSVYKPSDIGACYEGDPFIAYLSARDPQGLNVTYELVGGSLPYGLTLDGGTGIISGTGNLTAFDGTENLGVSSTWIFTVGASDSINNAAQDIQSFSITIKTIEHPPVISSTAGGVIFNVNENENITAATIENPAGAVIESGGVQLLGVSDLRNLGLTWEITSGSLPSGITMSSSGFLTGTAPATPPLMPDGVSYPFTVTVTNTENLSSSFDCTIQVNDVDTGPVWVTPPGSLGTFLENTAIGPIQLEASSYEGYEITYYTVSGTLGSGITLLSNGVIYGSHTNATPGVPDNFTVTIAANDGQIAANETFTIEFLVLPNPPSWVTAAGSLGVEPSLAQFSYQLEATDPQNYALTYSLASGTLPTGLTLSSNGLISGTCNQVSANTVSTFTVAVSNGYYSEDRSFSIEVDSAPIVAPTWETPNGANLYTGYSGAAWAYYLEAYDTNIDPTRNVSFSAESLPDGFYLAPASFNGQYWIAEISGNLPTVVEPTTIGFNIQITNGFISVEQVFNVVANPVPYGTAEFTSDGSITIPGGVSSITFDWIIGGGGAGGAGTQLGYGGGGAGGGSGGVYEGQVVSVNPGDVISVTIGAGGLPNFSEGPAGTSPSAYNGNPGSSTVVSQNGTPIFTAGGGGGGPANQNVNSTTFPVPGGTAGEPSGSTGGAGTTSANDHFSGNGGNGASGPIPGSSGGTGGVPGSQTSPSGNNGIGYGSGGGGGGDTDRSGGGINFWSGGSGIQGYVLLSFGGATALVSSPLPGGGTAGSGETTPPPNKFTGDA